MKMRLRKPLCGFIASNGLEFTTDENGGTIRLGIGV